MILFENNFYRLQFSLYVWLKRITNSDFLARRLIPLRKFRKHERSGSAAHRIDEAHSINSVSVKWIRSDQYRTAFLEAQVGSLDSPPWQLIQRNRLQLIWIDHVLHIRWWLQLERTYLSAFILPSNQSFHLQILQVSEDENLEES